MLLLASILCLTLQANAQQALFGRQEVISPEIHPDNTVTFRFRDAKAIEVKVTGDFLPTQKVETPRGTYDAPGTADLKEGENGVWTYTTPQPLPSELYLYSFIVDGLKVNDPANVYRIRDIATINNFFIIGGGQGDWYRVKEVPHGAVIRCWYDSPTLKMQRRLTIYTPPGYAHSGKRYPVLYLLHGVGGDEEAWISRGGCASQILDNLIASGKAQPMIVVMPNGNVAQEAAPGESPAGFVKPSANLPHTMDGTFEASFPDIVNYVDKTFRTIKKKDSRAIAGLSMGGFHALHISAQYPGMFGYVGLFSAAILPREGSRSPIYADQDKKMDAQFAQKPLLYWIGIGKADFLYKANADYRKKLDEKGYKYVYFESEGGHIWRNWRLYLTRFAPLLFQKH
ncbi:MAG: esterase [Tannerella sp.]|nr:esterase [Tannerella sp.]